MPFERVLVATDFGDAARAALEWAIDLSGALEARIIVAHVFDLPLAGLPDASIIVSAETASRMSAEAQASLDTVVAHARGKGATAEGVLRQGDPRQVIPEIAASLDASLIVVGSHGRRGLARSLLGSVAEDILRRSQTPVVVVRQRR